MNSRHRPLAAAIFLSFLLPLAPCPSSAQTSSALVTSTDQQPPFDKLELFAFFAAGPIDTYAAEIIRRRGCTFAPDAAFIAAFPTPKLQQILTNIKPRTSNESSPDRDAAYALLPVALDATHHRRFDVSEANYQKALQLAPDSATLHLAYASNFLLVPDGAKAEGEARRSLDLWPGNAEAHGVLSLALMVQSRFPEAAAEARETLRLFPGHRSAKLQLGVSLAQNHQYNEALPVLRSAVLALPGVPIPHKFLGISLLHTMKFDDAIAELRWYVSSVPSDAEGHYLLGVALRSAGHTNEANSQFQEALRLKPADAQIQAAANPNSSSSSAEELSGPKPDDGSVSGNIYTNKFFGFSYEFPKDWTVMSSNAARATLEMGSVLMDNGDPTEQDLKQALLRKNFSLLFVLERLQANRPVAASSIQINALPLPPFSQMSPDAFLQAIINRLHQRSPAIQIAGLPKKLSINGRDFVKASMSIPLSTGTSYVSELVTTGKGFALFFVFSSFDQSRLPQIEQSLQSIQFLNDPN
jgi:Flp pilus assembly protein TadD